MIFQERKIEHAEESGVEQGYSYFTEDVFGKVTIESPVKLDADTLDEMIVVMLRANLQAETVTGEVKIGEGIVKYTFQKASLWEEDDEDLCKNIPTSTPERVSAFILIKNYAIRISKWCKRFAEAFQSAWRKAQHDAQ